MFFEDLVFEIVVEGLPPFFVGVYLGDSDYFDLTIFLKN
jgi:hypothetical protein